MAWTFYAKHLVNQNVLANLRAQGIAYEDFITYPSVGNTILWQTTIKSPDAYYYSTYSLLDQDPSMSFVKLPKNHELLQPYENERYVKILKWFAQDYYNVLALDNGQLQFNNLRFGLLGDGSKEPQKAYVFKFLVGLFDGKFDARQFRDIETSEMRKDLQAFWQRLKGSKPQAQ
jgi:inner membrane protein